MSARSCLRIGSGKTHFKYSVPDRLRVAVSAPPGLGIAPVSVSASPQGPVSAVTGAEQTSRVHRLRGKFAVVRKCTEKCTGRVYAAKFLKKRRRGKDSRPEIIHEIAVLELAKPCPHIVDLYEVYETGHEIILVLEYIAGGEIFNLCVPERDEAFSENQIVRLVRQIIEGVYFLHQNNIVHLDLKPQNILLSGVDSAEDVKIVDFGLSRKLSETIALREIMGTTDYVGTGPQLEIACHTHGCSKPRSRIAMEVFCAVSSQDKQRQTTRKPKQDVTAIRKMLMIKRTKRICQTAAHRASASVLMTPSRVCNIWICGKRTAERAQRTEPIHDSKVHVFFLLNQAQCFVRFLRFFFFFYEENPARTLKFLRKPSRIKECWEHVQQLHREDHTFYTSSF
uniref:non-specific serine/threonine protein kinase n=1 Tax=Leptobrachium leishanense TaxID=445787 RepID=A0A8C5QTT4_9ANUR